MERERIEELFYGRPEHQRRFTQDFPILPDVWIAYGRTPGDRVEVLLTPHTESNAAAVATALRARLALDRSADGSAWKAEHPGLGAPRVLFNESVVLATLSFWELLRGALPLTDWWKQVIAPLGQEMDARRADRTSRPALAADRAGKSAIPGADPKLLLKLIRIAGAIECERRRPAGARGARRSADAAGDRRLRRFVRSLTAGPAARGRHRLEHQPQPRGQHERLAVADDGEGRRRGARVRSANHRHSLGRARHGHRREAPGVQADGSGEAQVGQAGRGGRRRNPEPRDQDVRFPAHQGAARSGRRGGDRSVRRRRRRRCKPVRDGAAALAAERAGRSTGGCSSRSCAISHAPALYKPPTFESHGTHVAGILAANWPDAPESTPLQEPLLRRVSRSRDLRPARAARQSQPTRPTSSRSSPRCSSSGI